MVECERHWRRLLLDSSCNVLSIYSDDFVWVFFLVELRPVFLDELVGDVVVVGSCIDEGRRGNAVEFDCFV